MTTDLDKLIEEAQAQTYNPRAQRCWPWWHAWTMWGGDNARQQSRRCVRCGLEQRLALAHVCKWVTDHQRNVTNPDGHCYGIAYYQHCDGCGDRRRKNCAL